MKLYRNRNGVHRKFDYAEATLDDIKAALAEHGMVAVPVEPGYSDHARICRAIRAVDVSEQWDYMDMYKAMIKAAEAETNES